MVFPNVHAIYGIGYLIPVKLIKLSFGHFFFTGNEKLYTAIGYANFVPLYTLNITIVFGKKTMVKKCIYSQMGGLAIPYHRFQWKFLF